MDKLIVNNKNQTFLIDYENRRESAGSFALWALIFSPGSYPKKKKGGEVTKVNN
jgi:hypothetical protein